MQPIQSNVTTLIGLATTAIASVAILLYISVARDFLPGIVELTVALSVALIFCIFTFVPREPRKAMQRHLNKISTGRIGFAAAGVAILAITALLALFIKNFPWPAPLILVVFLMAFAIRDDERSDSNSSP